MDVNEEYLNEESWAFLYISSPYNLEREFPFPSKEKSDDVFVLHHHIDDVLLQRMRES
jgi:hypothetical protein